MSVPPDEELHESDDLEATAGEYVLGTLTGAERAAFASRLSVDESARGAVMRWERRLSSMHRVAADVAPPREVWTRIERALGGANGDDRGIAANGAVASRDMMRSRNRWRAFAVASAALAAALAGVILLRATDMLRVSEPASTYVAAVNRGGDKPALIITVDLKSRQVLVRCVAARAPAGHSLELWYISGGAKPRSMGIVGDATARTVIPQGAVDDSTATFAVSVEPPGGSKTGSPTGEVLYSGQLIKE